MMLFNSIARGYLIVVVKIFVVFIVCLQFLLASNVFVTTLISFLIFTSIAAFYRFDIVYVWVAFSLPWLLILFFSMLEISNYSRSVELETIRLVVLLLLISYIVLPSASVIDCTRRETLLVKHRVFLVLFSIYLILTFSNVVIAGYIPLVQLLISGDSGYMGFGLKGLYGFYNAFSNAFGLLAFYIWILGGGRFYRNVFFLVLFFFLLFMTRQNIISLVVEAFFVYQFIARRVSPIFLFSFAAIFLVAFGFLGDLRLGKDIVELAEISDGYLWIPSSVIWLYSYCYFNLLNLDNAIAMYKNPVFDFSSVLGLVPSFLRPSIEDAESVLEVSSFTVGSFVLPIYRDLGFWLLIILFGLICYFVRRIHMGVKISYTFGAIACYAVVYFCFLFSFFENFWFYLPVIFQLPFIYFFKSSVFSKSALRGQIG